MENLSQSLSESKKFASDELAALKDEIEHIVEESIINKSENSKNTLWKNHCTDCNNEKMFSNQVRDVCNAVEILLVKMVKSLPKKIIQDCISNISCVYDSSLVYEVSMKWREMIGDIIPSVLSETKKEVSVLREWKLYDEPDIIEMKIISIMYDISNWLDSLPSQPNNGIIIVRATQAKIITDMKAIVKKSNLGLDNDSFVMIISKIIEIFSSLTKQYQYYKSFKKETMPKIHSSIRNEIPESSILCYFKSHQQQLIHRCIYNIGILWKSLDSWIEDLPGNVKILSICQKNEDSCVEKTKNTAQAIKSLKEFRFELSALG